MEVAQSAMLNPLQSHIAFLENMVQNLRDRLTRTGLSVEEIEDIELQLSLSESALDHYRQAYALELKVTNSEPPNHPAGTEQSGESQGGSRSPSKKREGLVGIGLSGSGKTSGVDRRQPKVCRRSHYGRRYPVLSLEKTQVRHDLPTLCLRQVRP